MNIVLIVLTIVFTVCFLIIARINAGQEQKGYSTDFDFFWLKNCLIFREVDVLLFALIWFSSFFLVINTVWGPLVWSFWSLCGLSVNVYNINTYKEQYDGLCWESEKNHYLMAYILSIFSNGIWVLMILISLSKLIMFVLESEPWNR